MTHTWPADWFDRKAGVGCHICAQGRPVETAGGVRFYSGEFADAYLRKRAHLPGQSMVIWRGRHASDLIDLSDEEAAGYMNDLRRAARLLNTVFEPCQINYLTFGNSVPHIHTYVVPRYLDDPNPGAPLLPLVETEIDRAELQRQLEALERAAE